MPVAGGGEGGWGGGLRGMRFIKSAYWVQKVYFWGSSQVDPGYGPGSFCMIAETTAQSH